ncbi:unnamed protein product [Nippostrongylus brasiliensis]|uniref:LD31742p (inferred by orthology to a D. melanogaster protein) n=1 Tax=Nippostrongylus brasiliensis TaxID=27835 RepID=A0A0N4Y6J2_NIPBR|nr:unnamed protein product [Nippostrongylus brasiliensis]
MANGKVPSDGYDVLRKYTRKANRITHSVGDVVFPFLLHEPSALLHVACVLSISAVFVLGFVFAVRATITIVLYYKGWLFETVGEKPSLPTKLFMALMQVMSKRASFFSYQGLLPWMLPPAVKDTLKTYLETVRPLLNDDEFEKITNQATDFQNTVAAEIQKKLWMKWLISRNYLSDWWKEVVYMRHRSSLIHTNVACADVIYQTTTSNQAARAAFVTLNRQQFCRDIFTKNSMKPISMGGIPLCTTQYSDYHRSLRVPRETSGEITNLSNKLMSVHLSLKSVISGISHRASLSILHGK